MSPWQYTIFIVYKIKCCVVDWHVVFICYNTLGWKTLKLKLNLLWGDSSHCVMMTIKPITNLSDTIIYLKVFKSAVFKYFDSWPKHRQAGCKSKKIKFYNCDWITGN